MASENTIKTKSKFGVPVTGNEAGILMPKLKFRFRVSLLDGFGGLTETKKFTQNVMNVTRPKINYEEVVIDSYNSKVYVQGKHAWDPITVVIRDDITNSVSRIVGAQNQRQLNHFEQTSPVAGTDYKFNMQIEILDGQSSAATEVWELEGCFLTNVDYSDTDYATNEPVTVSMTVRYDNAIHLKGTSSIVGSLADGNPFGDATGQNPGASNSVGA
jgi:hypothetical protein